MSTQHVADFLFVMAYRLCNHMQDLWSRAATVYKKHGLSFTLIISQISAMYCMSIIDTWPFSYLKLDLNHIQRRRRCNTWLSDLSASGMGLYYWSITFISEEAGKSHALFTMYFWTWFSIRVLEEPPGTVATVLRPLKSGFLECISPRLIFLV